VAYGGQTRDVEFINRHWYWINWDEDRGVDRAYTINLAYDFIIAPKEYRLGTKEDHYHEVGKTTSDKENSESDNGTSTDNDQTLAANLPVQEFTKSLTEYIAKKDTEELVEATASLLISAPPTTTMSGSVTIAQAGGSRQAHQAQPPVPQPQPQAPALQPQAPAQAGGAPGGRGGAPSGGGGRGGSPPQPPGGGANPPQQQPVQAAPAPTNGALKGSMPIFFMGERGKVNTFLQMFNYFRNANHWNEVMTNPFQRANLLLTFIQGPKVKQWAARKGEELTLAVLGDPDNHVLPTHQDNDKALWTNLLMVLRTAYSEYYGAEGAYRAIKDLRQKEGHVENYIVKFENLLSKAEWG